MKNYHLYLFTQDNCPPCERLKSHIAELPTEQREELDVVPLKTASGGRTMLANDLDVSLTPTLVVVHETVSCEPDPEVDEICDLHEEPVERYVGANNIIEHLSATLDSYTYALDGGGI